MWVQQECENFTNNYDFRNVTSDNILVNTSETSHYSIKLTPMQIFLKIHQTTIEALSRKLHSAHTILQTQLFPTIAWFDELKNSDK